jgi:hypothetical protein
VRTAGGRPDRQKRNGDGFVKNPISALRFIPLSLRRTARTPHSTGFARLELGLFTKPSGMMTCYEFITGGWQKAEKTESL